ncbi:NAD(P)H-binding protein [Streptomyces sp. NPDC005181]|uniref:SDR family oxidoreductase n=1 Tax=Streptomyces sp. NPDC005181 TaxID=3156869 RepID=UPI0033A2E73E
MIVATGATGNVGRELVRILASAGEQVTAVSRRPPAHLPDGVQHQRADLAEPESLRTALDGADAL